MNVAMTNQRAHCASTPSFPPPHEDAFGAWLGAWLGPWSLIYVLIVTDNSV